MPDLAAGPDGAQLAVRRLLADHTGTRPDDWHLVFKARYGLQVAFDALRAHRGDGEVATQIFTCSTAVDPILVAGLRPTYAEVSPDSVALDPDRLEVGEQTRAVMLQHTFGIVDQARAAGLRAHADRVDALLIEDAAHCLGQLARDADGRPLADVSVHSFGAEKMLPTRFGGAVWINPDRCDASLHEAMAQRLRALPAAGRAVDLRARAYITQVRVLNRLPQAVAGQARHTLTRARLFEPLISDAEARGGLQYAPLAPSDWMVEQMGRALPDLARVEAQRAAATATYRRELADVVQVPASVRDDAPLVRFPFFVAPGTDPERVIARVTEAGFYAGRWYRPALFPGTPDPGVFGYRPGDPALATTEDLIARVVNLPTNLSAERAQQAAAVVREAVAG